jgi:hypothetical protein
MAAMDRQHERRCKMTASKNKPTTIRKGAGRGQRGEAPGEGASTAKAREARAASVATGSGRYGVTKPDRRTNGKAKSASQPSQVRKESEQDQWDVGELNRSVQFGVNAGGGGEGESFQGLIGIDHLREIVADSSQDPQLRLTAASKLASIERHAESHTSGPVSKMPRAVLLAEIARIKAELEG